MTAKVEGGTDVDVVHSARRLFLGSNFRHWLIATTTAILVSLCIVVIQFAVVGPLLPGSAYRWSPSGLPSILFLLCLVVVAAIYSHAGDGLLDCCAIFLLPLFISNVTFASVALSIGDPIPIWEWSFGSQFVPYLGMALYSALVWGIRLGTLGFVSGAVLRLLTRTKSN